MTMSFSRSSEPLQQHGRLRTDDVDLAQQVVAQVYEPHTLSPVGRGCLDARLNAVQLGSVTLGYLTYGTEAHITLPASEHWYHINVTLAGSSRVTRETGGRGTTQGMAHAAILLPHRAQTIAWAADAAQFALKIPRADLEGHLATLTRSQILGPIDFDLMVNLDSRAGKGLLRCIDFVRTEWDEDGILARNGDSRRQLESMLLTNLLMAATGPHQAILQQLDETPRSSTVKSALDYIHDHVGELPSPTDVAAAIGVSARTLQLRFLNDLGRTPSQYLRDIRLRGVRDALLYPRSSEVTVTDAASAHGFFNLGRFSSLYKSVYGESPSETLRKTKNV